MIIEGRRREPWESDRPKRETRREQSNRDSRVLYHIGKTPPIPQPAHTKHARASGRKIGDGPDQSPEGAWVRPGRPPTSSGVFLTNNPRRVGSEQGVKGNVYAYRVPEHIIKKGGGIKSFDRATELLVPHDDWHHVKFLGKSADKAKFDQEVKNTPKRVKYRGYQQYLDRKDPRVKWNPKKGRRDGRRYARDGRVQDDQGDQEDQGVQRPDPRDRDNHHYTAEDFAKRKRRREAAAEAGKKAAAAAAAAGVVRESYKDLIPGGLADKSDPSDFNSRQLAMGIKVEMEHTRSKAIAREIAMDHLKEDPAYYSKLKKIHSESRTLNVLLTRTPLLSEADDCASRRNNKPWRTPGGNKKFAVCATEGGKSKLVRFGDPGLSIKRHRKGRRDNFRARHGCGVRPNTKTRLKAGYWACKTWEKKKTVGDVMGESYRDRIPGGKADKSDPSDFDPRQLAMGIKVEMEHTKSVRIAREIAMDHLKEDPAYYSKLKKVHKESRTLRALTPLLENQPVPTDPEVRAKMKNSVGYPPPGMIRMSAYPAGKGDSLKGPGADAEYPDTPDGRRIAKAHAWQFPSKRIKVGNKTLKV